MSAFRGIATGFLQAKIRNTEANDALKANTLARVGETLIGETIPNAIAAEKVRRTNYDMLSSEFTPNFAEVADKSGFTLNDDTMKVLREKLKEGNLDKKALENASFETDFNTRYNTRVATAEEKYNPILQKIGIDNIGGLGFNTVEALVKPTTTTAKDTMADAVTQTPIKFDSMQLSDYLTPMSGTYQVGATEFAKVAQPFRGFGSAIKFDAQGNVDFNLPGTKDLEYRALYAVTNDVSSQFLDKDKKVNISQAVEQADRVLRSQTQNVIAGITNDYNESSAKGVITSTATSFSDSFNSQYPTDDAKIEALTTHLASLGSRSEQKYFAASFPTGVTIGGQDAKTILLNLTR
tara:strand:- start:4129 stop:5181 length:1053 start_codon:yes stop_codon:yes gene_type:complete